MNTDQGLEEFVLVLPTDDESGANVVLKKEVEVVARLKFSDLKQWKRLEDSVLIEDRFKSYRLM
jgi:hypothetical protein